MSRARRLAANAVSSWGVTGIDAAISLAMVPFLLSELGKEGYGLICVLLVFSNLTTLTDLGLRQSLSRNLAEEVAKDDKPRFNQLLNTALIFYLGIGGLLALGCVAAAPWMARGLNVPDSLFTEGVLTIRFFGGCTILLSVAIPVLDAVAYSTNRYDLVNYRNGVLSIVRGVALFVALSWTSLDVYAWAVVHLFVQALAIPIGWICAHRVWPSVRFALSAIRRSAIAPLFGVGLQLFLIQTAQYLRDESMPLVISACIGLPAVAVYRPARMLLSLVRPLVSVLIVPLVPMATQLYVSGQRETLQAVLIRGTRLTLALAIPLLTVLIIFAYPILDLWVGSQLGADTQIASRVLIVSALNDLLTFATGTQLPVLISLKRIGFISIVMATSSIISLLAAIVLMTGTAWGVLGAVVPVLAVSLIRRPIETHFAVHAVELAPARYRREAYARPLVFFLALLGVALPLQYIFHDGGIAALGLALGIYLIMLVPALWYIALAPADRTTIQGLLSWSTSGRTH